MSALTGRLAPDLEAATADWQRWLAKERQASPHTVAAYRRDLTDFLLFLNEHLGAAPALTNLATLRPGDFRGWLAARAGRGLQRTSTARALSVIRGFFRWLQKHGLAENAAIAAIRTPKVPRSVPRALSQREAGEVVDSVGGASSFASG